MARGMTQPPEPWMAVAVRHLGHVLLEPAAPLWSAETAWQVLQAAQAHQHAENVLRVLAALRDCGRLHALHSEQLLELLAFACSCKSAHGATLLRLLRVAGGVPLNQEVDRGLLPVQLALAHGRWAILCGEYAADLRAPLLHTAADLAVLTALDEAALGMNWCHQSALTWQCLFPEAASFQWIDFATPKNKAREKKWCGDLHPEFQPANEVFAPFVDPMGLGQLRVKYGCDTLQRATEMLFLSVLRGLDPRLPHMDHTLDPTPAYVPTDLMQLKEVGGNAGVVEKFIARLRRYKKRPKALSLPDVDCTITEDDSWKNASLLDEEPVTTESAHALFASLLRRPCSKPQIRLRKLVVSTEPHPLPEYGPYDPQQRLHQVKLPRLELPGPADRARILHSAAASLTPAEQRLRMRLHRLAFCRRQGPRPHPEDRFRLQEQKINVYVLQPGSREPCAVLLSRADKDERQGAARASQAQSCGADVF
eukprot:m.227126 g.227126  ORF g.227126 m.227126 type:complete len:480 (-) comp22366_c2_seq1:176-1615(-)